MSSAGIHAVPIFFPNLHDTLAPFIRNHKVGDRMTPTGVPPHVSLLVNIRELAGTVGEVAHTNIVGQQ